MERANNEIADLFLILLIGMLFKMDNIHYILTVGPVKGLTRYIAPTMCISIKYNSI